MGGYPAGQRQRQRQLWGGSQEQAQAAGRRRRRGLPASGASSPRPRRRTHARTLSWVMSATAGGSAASPFPETERKARRASGRKLSQSWGATSAERCRALCRYNTRSRVRHETCLLVCVWVVGGRGQGSALWAWDGMHLKMRAGRPARLLMSPNSSLWTARHPPVGRSRRLAHLTSPTPATKPKQPHLCGERAHAGLR